MFSVLTCQLRMSDHFSMTNEQRNLKRVLDQQSETREKINTMLGQPEADRSDTFTADLRAMTTKSIDLEVEYRAASQAAADTVEKATTITLDAETQELLELRSKSRFGRFLASAISGRAIDGVEAEYRSAAGGGDGIPLDLFEQDRPKSSLEFRADAATVVPSAAQGDNVAALQPFVFSESIAPMLGIDMPLVGSGNHTEPRISVSLTAGVKTKGTAQDSTAATIVGVTAKPRRIAARLTVPLEDIASFGNNTYESSLRENARSVLGHEYDNQIINGNGTSPNVEGLLDQLNNPTNPGTIATFDLFVAGAMEGIDGLFAKTLRDVRLIVNPATYQLAGGKFRGTDGEMTALSHLSAQLGSFSTNSRMPAKAGNIAKAIIYRAGRPGIRTAVHPQWGSIAIDDIYTDAASGQRHFTLSVLVGSKLLITQPGAYRAVEFKVS